MTYMRLLLALTLPAMLCGCSRLTIENYSKIKGGTEYAEVVRILGKPDNCSDAMFVKNCVWGDEQKNITVNFVGDKALLFTSRNIK